MKASDPEGKYLMLGDAPELTAKLPNGQEHPDYWDCGILVSCGPYQIKDFDITKPFSVFATEDLAIEEMIKRDPAKASFTGKFRSQMFLSEEMDPSGVLYLIQWP